MTFTGYRSKSSIGISLLKVKDCFQDNCCKDKTYFSYRQIFCDVFLLYIKCVGTQMRYLTIVHIKERGKDGYRHKRMATETKKSRNFHKLLPRLSKRLRGGYYLPI